MKTTTQNQNEVLFQKLGNTWYVFTEIENDFVYSALPDGMDPRETKMELFEVIEDHLAKVSKQMRRSPEIAA